MQGSFEKRVQEKLDELKLTPSAPVWEKIELQIREEKKRRRGLLWFPFLIMLLFGTAWWLWEGVDKKGEIPPSATIIPPTQEQSRTTGTTALETKNTSPGEKKVRVPVSSLVTEKNAQPLATLPVRKGADQHETAFPFQTAKQKATRPPVRNNSEKERREQQKAERWVAQLPNDKSPNSTIIDHHSAPVSNQTSTEKEETMRVDPVKTPSPVLVDSTKILVEKDTIAVKRKVATLNRKWKITLTAQAGWSSPAPSLLSATRPDYTSSPVPNIGGNFSSNYGIPRTGSGRAAYAFGLGLLHDISGRFAVSFALQYSVYRTVSRVGTFRPLDTTVRYQSAAVNVGGYYRNDNQQDYTTRMAVLEVPVSIDFKIVNALPLYLSVGGVYGRLLNSNALTFHPPANFYYQNDQSLNRNHFSVFSSLQYGILNKKGFALRAGPVVQYQVSTFQNESGTASKQLLFAGAKTTFHF